MACSGVDAGLLPCPPLGRRATQRTTLVRFGRRSLSGDARGAGGWAFRDKARGGVRSFCKSLGVVIPLAGGLWETLHADRRRPPHAQLAALDDPERFVWAILPHAARSFSFCIALLPRHTARPLAVAYLYCRMLDTCEDLPTSGEEKAAKLAAFRARFDVPIAG